MKRETYERLLQEKRELKEKQEKLSGFIDAGEAFLKLSPANQFLLNEQLGAMRKYEKILDVRIELNSSFVED